MKIDFLLINALVELFGSIGTLVSSQLLFPSYIPEQIGHVNDLFSMAILALSVVCLLACFDKDIKIKKIATQGSLVYHFGVLCMFGIQFKTYYPLVVTIKRILLNQFPPENALYGVPHAPIVVLAHTLIAGSLIYYLQTLKQKKN